MAWCSLFLAVPGEKRAKGYAWRSENCAELFGILEAESFDIIRIGRRSRVFENFKNQKLCWVPDVQTVLEVAGEKQ
jgi:hypothetical protein